MPSVDIVSQIDMQEVDNAVNIVKKEMANRYDFRHSKSEIELNKTDKTIRIVADDDMKLRAIKEMLVGRFIQRKVSPKVLDFGAEEKAALGLIRIFVKLKQGIDPENSRKIVKIAKDMKLKVQVTIQGEQVRLNGNKIDDLQAIMQAVRADESVTVPVQFVNMKR